MSAVAFQIVEEYCHIPITDKSLCCTCCERPLGIFLLCGTGPSPCSCSLKTPRLQKYQRLACSKICCSLSVISLSCLTFISSMHARANLFSSIINLATQSLPTYDQGLFLLGLKSCNTIKGCQLGLVLV